MPAPTCTIPGCTRPTHARGICRMHYDRMWRNNGDPLSQTERRTIDADEVLFLVSCGTPIEEALTRVEWTLAAAERWARRNRHTQLLEAVKPATARHKAAS